MRQPDVPELPVRVAQMLPNAEHGCVTVQVLLFPVTDETNIVLNGAPLA